MSEWGVFAVDRGIWDHPVLGEEPFTGREAWMWLLSAAAWKQRKIGTGGRVVTIERGEFCFALRFLQRKWQWKPGRVERFLDRLEKHDMIRDTSRDKAKIYSISNYNEYQRVSLPDRDTQHDSEHDATATASRHDRDKEENIQTFKQEKEESISSASRAKPARSKNPLNGHQRDFEAFWAVYPRREARGAAMKAYGRALARAGPDQILAGAKRYAAARQDEEAQYTKMPATWLNADCWLDEAPPDDGALDPKLKEMQEIEAAFRKEKGYDE